MDTVMLRSPFFLEVNLMALVIRLTKTRDVTKIQWDIG